MVKLLTRKRVGVVVFDNLSTGHRDAIGTTQFIEGDLRDRGALKAALANQRYDVVMHFAASYDVAESMQYPEKYHDNNAVGSLNLLESMHEVGVTRLVFSSTCAVYGDPQHLPITEKHPRRPVNPYGTSKLAAEHAMEEFGGRGAMRVVSLRYFNAAGCDAEGELGERHEPETHLIPLVLREAFRIHAGGDPGDTRLSVYGTDFDTQDGTCIRDYVHVSDLCTAHCLAMERVLKNSSKGTFEAFNLGTGTGHSVLEVIDACRRVTRQDIRYRVAPRRPGDTPRLVASVDYARTALGWRPEYTDLDQVVATAWNWMSRAPYAALSPQGTPSA